MDITILTVMIDFICYFLVHLKKVHLHIVAMCHGMTGTCNPGYLPSFKC